MNFGCLLLLKIVEENKMLANDGRNPRGYRCENNEHRENPGIESASESLRAARLKCIRSAAESRLSASAKWKRRLQQLSRNSTDRYPFPSGGPHPIVWSGPDAERGEKTWKKDRERKRKGDKESDIVRQGEEQKKRFRRLPTTETPRNRRRQGEGGRDREKRKRNKRTVKTEMQIKRLMSLEHKLSPCAMSFARSRKYTTCFINFQWICVYRIDEDIYTIYK